MITEAPFNNKQKKFSLIGSSIMTDAELREVKD